MLVSKIIEETEECVRCVMHPLMYSRSKKKLNPASMLPPRGDNKVSFLRLLYCQNGLNTCINHGKSIHIKDNTFVGFAIIKPRMIVETLEDIKRLHPKIILPHVEIIYAPMANGNYIDTTIDIYTEDTSIDLPMHADMVYYNMEIGELQTTNRMFAHNLMKKAQIHLITEHINNNSLHK